MRAFRIASQRHGGTVASAFSGQGSLYGDGRWHHRGRLAVYVAQHASLATLEILVHLDRASDIVPHVLYEIDVPDDMITVPRDLPTDWQNNIDAARQFGDAWLDGKTAPALKVPSVVTPSEINLVLNPAHPAFWLDWVLRGPEAVRFDPRLFLK